MSDGNGGGGDGAFVASPPRDNWYQSSSFYGSSFALITSVDEAGLTSIGPYQLSFPFEVIKRRSWMVISRPSSNTVANVRRTGKCALNFIEYDRQALGEVGERVQVFAIAERLPGHANAIAVRLEEQQ